MFKLLIASYVINFVACCNTFGDYCDAEEENAFLTMERSKRSINSTEQIAFANAVTETLDRIFHESNYDAKLRPNYDGPSTVVMVNLAIRSMGPVDETKNTFT